MFLQRLQNGGGSQRRMIDYYGRNSLFLYTDGTSAHLLGSVSRAPFRRQQPTLPLVHFARRGMPQFNEVDDRMALERIARALREYAAKENLSLEGLGPRLGVSRAVAYQLVGSEKTTRPRAEKIPGGVILQSIARVTGCSADWLLGFEGAVKNRIEARPIANLPASMREYVFRRLAHGADSEDARLLAERLEEGGALLDAVVALARQSILPDLQRARLDRARELIQRYNRQVQARSRDEKAAELLPKTIIARAMTPLTVPDQELLARASRLTRRTVDAQKLAAKPLLLLRPAAPRMRKRAIV